MSILSDHTTALAGPALRLHLLELYLSHTDMPDLVLSLAQAAELWIAGAAEPSGDPRTIRGWDAIELPVPDMPTTSTVVAGAIVHGDRPLTPADEAALTVLVEAARARLDEEDADNETPLEPTDAGGSNARVADPQQADCADLLHEPEPRDDDAGCEGRSGDAAIACGAGKKGETEAPDLNRIVSHGRNAPWLINGGRATTAILWKRANAELKSRRQKTIKRVD